MSTKTNRNNSPNEEMEDSGFMKDHSQKRVVQNENFSKTGVNTPGATKNHRGNTFRHQNRG